MRRVIWLQTFTVFLARWRNHLPQLLNVCGINDVSQTEIHTPEPPVPELNASEVKRAIENLKRHKLPGTEQIPEELTKAVGRTVSSEIYKLINSIWDKRELPEKWTESINIPIYKKGEKTHCCNYRGISLLSPTHKILSNILLSRLTPHAQAIIGDHQCGFWHNRSPPDHTFCIRQRLQKSL